MATGKVVLVTGTSSGFGYLVSKLLASKGYTVYATMRNIEAKHSAPYKELSAIEGITVLEMELTDNVSVNKTVDYVIEKEGKIDVLINNAGAFHLDLMESYTDTQLLEILNVDVVGPWRMIRASLPHFRKQQDGLIITVASSLGRFSCPFMSAYSTAKHGLEGLIEGLKYEVKGFGIDVAIIEPGIFPTQVFDSATPGEDQSRASEYGPLAGIPTMVNGKVHELFASGQAADPILVPEAMLKLIETEKGKRPLRTVVDPAAGDITIRVNAITDVESEKFLIASGMGDLL